LKPKEISVREVELSETDTNWDTSEDSEDAHSSKSDTSYEEDEPEEKRADQFPLPETESDDTEYEYESATDEAGKSTGRKEELKNKPAPKPRRSAKDEALKKLQTNRKKNPNLKVLMSKARTDDEPQLTVALKSVDKAKWKEAIKSEINTLTEMGTWVEAPLPMNKRTVGSTVVLKRKRNKDGNIAKYKARLTAQGFTQVKGIDYAETYTPVGRLHTLWTILCVSTIRGWQMHRMDVDSAYLNAPLDKEIWMRLPPRIDFTKPGNALLLKRALYGLKQSGRQWYLELRKALERINWQSCIKDKCLFIKKTRHGLRTMLLVYVDDLVIMGQMITDVNAEKQLLSGIFKMKDLGELNYVLGIRISRNTDGSIELDQEELIKRTLAAHLDNKDAKRTVPLLTVATYTLNESECCDNDRADYQKKIGSLLYIARHTRPDILTAVNMATRFCNNPSSEHAKLVNQILEYLNGTSSLRMRMYTDNKNTKLKITAYVDANWGSKEAGSRSRSGYAIYINRNLVIYACKTQHCIAMSTMEAEYIALSEVVKEIGWLTQLLDELGMDYKTPDVRCQGRQPSGNQLCARHERLLEGETHTPSIQLCPGSSHTRRNKNKLCKERGQRCGYLYKGARPKLFLQA
jgi:hypothetical protein